MTAPPIIAPYTVDFRCPRRDEVSIANDGALCDHWRNNGAFYTCSYCGSMHPEDFIANCMTGCQLTPTDKNYKVYIAVPNYTGAKFYFQHLPDEGKKLFLELLNKRSLQFAYPGYFYRLPFFVRPLEDAKTD